MVHEKVIDGIRYRRAIVNGVLQNFVINELGEAFKMNGTPKKSSKPSGNEKYYTLSYKKSNGKQSKVSVHRCVMETFNGSAVEDHNWETLRPDCFTQKQWMGFNVEQRIFMSKSGIHVDHMNGKKYDNNLSNLQYLWASDNIAKGNSSSDPIEQVKELVEKVCYVSPTGIMHGLSNHDVDITSYDNMIAFIHEEMRVMNDPFNEDGFTAFERNRYIKMADFLKKNKIAA